MGGAAMSIHLPVDHIVLLVDDLESAGSAFERSGFQVTPQTRHSPAMGTANRCIMLEGSYIEIMGIVAETPANATWRSLLAAGGGIRGFALGSSDIDATAGELTQADVPAEQVRHFSRMTGDGELRFSVTRIDPAATPGLQCLVCQHHTAELLWQPATMIHANGARRLKSVSLPNAASLEGLPAASMSDGVEISSGSGKLVFSGASALHADLQETCGIEIVVDAP